MVIIYISGLDGCGKTTQAKLLVASLVKKKINAEYMWLRWEPSLKRFLNFFKQKNIHHESSSNSEYLLKNENLAQSEWSNLKRQILSNTVARKAWLYYALNDYYYLCNQIMQTKSSEIVVVDRYIHDFIIDQAINLNLSPKKCTEILKPPLSKLPLPDLKLIIDISADVGYKRKMDGTSLYYLKQREVYYQEALGTKNTFHFNGLESISSIAEKLLMCVEQYLMIS